MTHCNEWFNDYWVILATIAGIAMLITVGNVLVELLILFATYFTRPVNLVDNINNSIRAISLIQFINLGLILLVINFNVGMKDFFTLESYFNGEFRDMTSMWYIKVGT